MPLVQHGFPDWYRLSGRADEVFVSTVEVGVASPVVYGPFFVGAHQALGLKFQATTNNVGIVFRFTDTSGGTILMNQRIDVNQGCTFDGSIPITGPWVTIELVFDPGVADFTIRVWSMQVAAMAADLTAAANVLFDWDNVTVPAATSQIVTVDRVWMGEASWWAISNAANWSVRFQTISRLGNVRLLDRQANGDARDRRTVFLPPQTLRFDIRNLDAAPKEFYIALTARPMWLGA